MDRLLRLRLPVLGSSLGGSYHNDWSLLLLFQHSLTFLPSGFLMESYFTDRWGERWRLQSFWFRVSSPLHHHIHILHQVNGKVTFRKSRRSALAHSSTRSSILFLPGKMWQVCLVSPFSFMHSEVCVCICMYTICIRWLCMQVHTYNIGSAWTRAHFIFIYLQQKTIQDSSSVKRSRPPSSYVSNNSWIWSRARYELHYRISERGSLRFLLNL